VTACRRRAIPGGGTTSRYEGADEQAHQKKAQHAA
tara:strand:- start:971 stop:1075 length:105 start_codon:yes stop_codon:yes gene_type:complete